MTTSTRTRASKRSKTATGRKSPARKSASKKARTSGAGARKTLTKKRTARPTAASRTSKRKATTASSTRAKASSSATAKSSSSTKSGTKAKRRARTQVPRARVSTKAASTSESPALAGPVVESGEAAELSHGVDLAAVVEPRAQLARSLKQSAEHIEHMVQRAKQRLRDVLHLPLD